MAPSPQHADETGALWFRSSTEPHRHFKDALDAAERGRLVVIEDSSSRAAVVDADRLRVTLSDLLTARPQAVAEADGWSLFIPGLPIGADASSLDQAVADLVDALREYAADWHAGLRSVPNHLAHWALFQLIDLSSDDQLRSWAVPESAVTLRSAGTP